MQSVRLNPPTKRGPGRLLHTGIRVCTIAAWLGVIIHITVRDRYNALALLHYALPMPGILLVSVVALGLCWLHARREPMQASTHLRWQRRLLFVAVLIAGSYTLLFDCRWDSWTKPSVQPNLFFWNVAHGRFGLQRIAHQLHEWNIPIIALVEADDKHATLPLDWSVALADYSVVERDAIVLATKGKIHSHRIAELGTRSRCLIADISLDQETFSIVVVDIASDLHLSREEPLKRLADIISKLHDRPTIVVGDFNTPNTSVWFEPVRQHARNGLETAGSGYLASWPIPAPVLTLDQIWTTELVSLESCWLGWSWLSDHRPIRAKVKQLPTRSR